MVYGTLGPVKTRKEGIKGIYHSIMWGQTDKENEDHFHMKKLQTTHPSAKRDKIGNQT